MLQVPLLERLDNATHPTAMTLIDALIEAEVHENPEQAQTLIVDFLMTGADLPEIDLALIAETLALLRPMDQGPPDIDLEITGIGKLGHYSFVCANGVWMGIGDHWMGYWLKSIQPKSLVFTNNSGAIKEVSHAMPQVASGQLVCSDEGVLHAIRFCARHANMNMWTPASVATRPTTAHGSSWIELIDALCKANELTWSKHQNSIVVRAYTPRTTSTLTASGHSDLGTFLQGVARTLDLELLIDDAVANIQIDVDASATDWQEALDCVAILNDLEWTITKDALHPRLIVTFR